MAGTTDGAVMTVLGPVDPGRLGITLVHEHIWMDSTPMLAAHGYDPDADGPFDAARAAEARWNPGTHPDNYRLTDADLIAAELAHLATAGAATVVDVTPVELGRDPTALESLARSTGLNIVMGAGHYLAAVHGPEVAARPERDLTALLVDEVENGVGGTGIRPGIIGEIGTSDPPVGADLRVLRAAAAAALATGLAVSVHLHPWGRTGELVADTLLEAGAPPDRIVLGHLTTAHADADYLAALAGRGTWLAFDLVGFDHSLLGAGRYPPSDADVVETVARLVGEGLGDRILVSQDLGVRSRLHAYGGWGYDHLLRHVVPLLRAAGLDDGDVERLLVDNPRRLLTVRPPGSPR